MEVFRGEKLKSIADNQKIYYSHGHDAGNFLKNIKFNHKFIFITHNSDANITCGPSRDFDCDVNLAPPNLTKWFAQNVCCKDDRLVPIPIGFENSEWFVNERKVEKILSLDHNKKNIRNLIYLNCNINNNREERVPLYAIAESRFYITIEKLHNGINFDSYLENLFNHEFMLCPPGHGHDVHQPWECLHAGTIPIMKRSINTLSIYGDLPVCFVDDWNELLDYKYFIEESKRIRKTKYDMKKLDFNYWKKLILDEASKL